MVNFIIYIITQGIIIDSISIGIFIVQSEQPADPDLIFRFIYLVGRN